MKTFVIAEIGVNHNGSEKLASEMVEAAHRCGADAVKFQTFKADSLVVKGAKKAEYQKRETGSGDQYSMLKDLEMSEAMHAQLVKQCERLGIEFMSTPFDNESAEFLGSLGMSRIKISSAEITNFPFLAFLAGFNKPLILSTGMASLDEIVDAVDLIQAERKRHGFLRPLAEMLVVLHCTSNYPTRLADVNLRAIATMRDKLNVPIGYSDHTQGITVAPAAVALGAVIIEKHFTLDRLLPGPDHKASLEPDQFKEMVTRIREVETALGSGEKAPQASELPVRDLVRRSIVLARDMVEGECITENDISFLRPGTGLAPREIEKVIGKRVIKNLKAGTILQSIDLS